MQPATPSPSSSPSRPPRRHPSTPCWKAYWLLAEPCSPSGRPTSTAPSLSLRTETVVPRPRLPNRPRPKRPNGAGALYPGGYIYVLHDGRRSPLHRLVMQEILGRPLLRSEHVHHLDGNPQNNRPENLRVLDAGEHSSKHNRKRPLLLWCAQCGRPMLTGSRRLSVPALCCSRKCAAAWYWRRCQAAKHGRPAPRPAPRRPIPDPG